MATSTTSTLSALFRRHFQEQLLIYPVQLTQYVKSGQKSRLPEGMGFDKTCWVRFNAPDANDVINITEGSRTSTSSSTITPTTIFAQFGQYGCSADVSDLNKYLNLYDVLDVAAQRLREAIALKNDTLVRNELVTGTTDAGATAITETYPSDITGASSAARFANLSTSSVPNGVMSVKDMVNNETVLKINRAPAYEDGYYRFFPDPRISSDIRKDTRWLDVHQYSDAMAIYQGEIGKWSNCRAIEHTNPFLEGTSVKGTYNGTTGTIISTIFTGRDAYGVCDIADLPAIQPTVWFLLNRDKSDFYNTTRVCGAEYYMAQRVLNGNFCLNFRSLTNFVSPVA